MFKSVKSSIGISSPIKSSSSCCKISSSIFNHDPISSPCPPKSTISGSCRCDRSSGSSNNIDSSSSIGFGAKDDFALC
ncbi:hypothetical protein HanXRQr2_Chr09g0362041 [Helianthus annuus]|uniref:Uncharacterized protein n=1 Tax=Helianthus annuus TaxID=4232 RepID=A0A9K3N6H0_HELAN|nr:hypothetical protein HanXRQr2_Chr09g0362041 [Helianthus annuus]KAJ0891074.1 hypothetical protein HanPSC8_Chr09g0349341 [Helianthus annuus]